MIQIINKKTVQASTLTIALMMGNVTYSTDQAYEDDTNFTQVSSSINSGWGWNSNKAQASSNTCPGCMEGTTSYGTDPGDTDWSGMGDYDGGGYDDGGGDYGGGGGDDGGSEPEYSAYEECLRDATLLNQGCSNARIISVTNEYTLCQALWTFEGLPNGTNPLTQAAAYAMCEITWNDKLDGVDAYCSAQFQTDLDQCE